MVRRSEKATTGGGGGRLRRRGRDYTDDDEAALEMQESGKLSLNNPLIPPELDEDIDDDLAFNSDDEEKYGHFFQRKSVRPNTSVDAKKKKKNKNKDNNNNNVTKKTKKSGTYNEDDDDDDDEEMVLQQLRALGEIEDEDDLKFHEGKHRGDDDDDDDEYMDLADMFDAAQADEKDKTTTKKQKTDTTTKKKNNKLKKKVDEDGNIKKRRRALVTEEAESIYGPTTTDANYNSAIRQVVAATPQSTTQTRLKQTLSDKRKLISVDIDEYKKERMLREEVREVVAEDLAKYNTFLREQRESKHVQLPMPMPESNPVPSTLGAIAAAAESLFASQKDKDISVASVQTDLTSTKGNAARVSAFRLAGKVNSLLSDAGLARPQLSENPTEEGVVYFNDENDEDGNGNSQSRKRTNKGEAPTTSYMAKLKAMLSYENARRRRLNRIKSKTYRRILRKEKDRENERREKAFELLHPEKARARLAEKLMKARVEERVTQKHKNTSKWVRHAKRFAQFDENTNDAINEQNFLHQKLMQKMEEDAEEDEYLNAAGDGRAGSEAASSEEERVVDYLIADATGKYQNEEGKGEGNNSKLENNKKKITSVLWKSIDENDNNDLDDVDDSTKSNMTPTDKARLALREMKFMQQAKEREEKRYTEVLDKLKEDIRRDMRGEKIDSDDEPSDLDEEEENDKKGKNKKTKTGSSSLIGTGVTIGRKVFQQKNDNGVKVLENIQFKQPRGIDAYGEQRGENLNSDNSEENESEDENWSINDDESNKEENNNNEEENKEKTLINTKSEIKKKRKNIQIVSENDDESKNSQISLSNGQTSNTSQISRKKAISTRITILPTGMKRSREDDNNNNNNTEEDNTTTSSNNKNNVNGVKREKSDDLQNNNDNDEDILQQQQDYLIARAFAEDEVDADFLAQKTDQVSAIMKPVDKNATLPGWGEWGGADAKLNTRHQAKLQTMQLQRQIEQSTLLKSRADAALEHVIINHDGVELVPDRMLLHMIPRPFSNPTEFARSMRHPQGPEWNTALTFKESNQPRVEVRQGHAVLPLDLSLRGKKKTIKTRRRKATEAA